MNTNAIPSQHKEEYKYKILFTNEVPFNAPKEAILRPCGKYICACFKDLRDFISFKDYLREKSIHYATAIA